jgi:hypothetical protein
VVLDSVHRLGVGEPEQISGHDGGHVPLRTGADPNDRVLKKRPLGENAVNARKREGRHCAGSEARRLDHLLGVCDLRRPAPGGRGDLRAIGAPVARNEDDDRTPVAVEDERLDDLAQLAADGARGVFGRGCSFLEFLDAGLDAGAAEEPGDTFDLLRPYALPHPTSVPAQP